MSATLARELGPEGPTGPIQSSSRPGRAGRTVQLAPDPLNSDHASPGPVGRSLVLFTSRVLTSSEALRPSEVVAQLTSTTLNQATTPLVTHATASAADPVLLEPIDSSTSIKS